MAGSYSTQEENQSIEADENMMGRIDKQIRTKAITNMCNMFRDLKTKQK